MALRPEVTAGLVRAFVEHRPPTPWKVWYVGPNFRYEQPQAGRYRQHHQLDVEVVGTADPDARRRGHRPARRLLPRPRAAPGRRCCSTRSATPADRPAYVDALRALLRRPRRRARPSRAAQTLAAQPAAGARLEAARGRRRSSPARRSCSTTCRRGAPPTSTGCRPGSTALGIAFELEPRLVRGLDYYTHTTFEFAVRRARRRPERHRRRRSLRRAGRAARRPAARRASASAPASSASCWRATPRACSPRRRPTVDVFVVDTTGGDDGPRCSPPSCARAGHRAPTGPSTAAA